MAKEKDVLAWGRKGSVRVGALRVAHLNDFRQTDALRAQLAATLTEHDVRGVVLDCAGLVYLISEVFGILVQSHKEQRAAGRRLVLCNVDPGVLDLLKINRLDQYLDIRPDCETAVASFAAQAAR